MNNEFDIETAKSPETIEREIDAQRASIGNIVDALESKLRGATTLAEVARQGFELVQRRAPGERRLRIHEPEDRPGRTVVEVLQDDRPFLVDTVRLALRRRALAEQLLLHPILAVRARRGRRARSASATAPGARASRCIHVEVFPRLEGAEERAAFEADLRERARASSPT